MPCRRSGRRVGFAREAIVYFACKSASDCGSCARVRGALTIVGAVHQERPRVQDGAPAPSRRGGCQEGGSRCARAGRVGYRSRGGGEHTRDHFCKGDERTRKDSWIAAHLLHLYQSCLHRLTSRWCRRCHGRTCTTIFLSSRTAFQKCRRCRKKRTRTEVPARRRTRGISPTPRPREI